MGFPREDTSAPEGLVKLYFLTCTESAMRLTLSLFVKL